MLTAVVAVAIFTGVIVVDIGLSVEMRAALRRGLVLRIKHPGGNTSVSQC